MALSRKSSQPLKGLVAAMAMLLLFERRAISSNRRRFQPDPMCNSDVVEMIRSTIGWRGHASRTDPALQPKPLHQSRVRRVEDAMSGLHQSVTDAHRVLLPVPELPIAIQLPPPSSQVACCQSLIAGTCKVGRP